MKKFVNIFDLSEVLRDHRIIVVGDIHGCYDELISLLHEVEFNYKYDRLIAVGDLVDRGPKSEEVLSFMKTLFDKGVACSILGNHDDKFYRHICGNKVVIGESLQKTIDQLGDRNDLYKDFIGNMPRIIRIPDSSDGRGRYVVHAGIRPSYHISEQSKEDVMYIRGLKRGNYFDTSEGDWNENEYRFSGIDVFYGHIMSDAAPKINSFNDGKINYYGLDGGCVYGGRLCAAIIDANDVKFESYKSGNIYSVNTYKDTNARTDNA